VEEFAQQEHKQPDPAPTKEPAPTRRNDSGTTIQAKLSVGAADDRYEQEADRVAAAVVRDIQRSRSNEQPVEEAPIGAQRRIVPNVRSVSRIQAKSIAPSVGLDGGDPGRDVESKIESARGGGRGLAEPVRRSMEQSFGADFSSVRIHDDSRSSELNNRIQAKAFTTGSDVFFRSGEYNPGTSGGQHLLAHELTHVVQQGGAGQLTGESKVQRNAVAPARSISRQPAEGLQRKAVPGLASLARPSGTWTDTGDGVFGFDTPSRASDVVALVTAIRAATADKPMRIKVLTGIHGSEAGGGYGAGHMVGTDTVDPALFLAEDREEEGHSGSGGWVNVLNVRNKTKDTITNWMKASSSVVVLAWCFSENTVAIWDHISADWEDGTKGTGFEPW
jgi:hypothetical protein